MPSIRPTTLTCLATATLLTLTACGSGDPDLAERQQAVAEAGAEVMPFDLDATTHIFTNTATGGIQDVVADDSDDKANIDLIGQHLESEAVKFRVGDFSDPEAIHGSGMPGLATLKERYSDIAVLLTDTDEGATIEYRTDDPELVSAIHDWFEAQTVDHGNHAQHNTP